MNLYLREEFGNYVAFLEPHIYIYIYIWRICNYPSDQTSPSSIYKRTTIVHQYLLETIWVPGNQLATNWFREGLFPCLLHDMIIRLNYLPGSSMVSSKASFNLVVVWVRLAELLIE